jgi:hypothetical protein
MNAEHCLDFPPSRRTSRQISRENEATSSHAQRDALWIVVMIDNPIG